MFDTVILAAGEGKRMRSALPKVLHQVAFKPLVQWVIDAAAGGGRTIVVVGHGAEQVVQALGDSVLYAEQKERLGTGHAVLQTESYFRGYTEDVLILCGDTPLITRQTIEGAYQIHLAQGNAATVLTASLENPFGYGRIVRDGDGCVRKIVEQKDATEEERRICEINSGMYFFRAEALFQALHSVTSDNQQGEYYLTDTLEILLRQGLKFGTYLVEDPDDIRGINDKVQLAQAEERMRRRIVNRHLVNGVTFLAPDTVCIGDAVEIGSDTVILPNVMLKGKTVIGNNCTVGPNAQITDSILADGVEVNSSVVLESTIGRDTHVGPFAYIRPNSHIGKSVKIGDFVEIKNSTIDDGTKVSHLTYVGDADVGKKVNFGCGTVLVNYDGQKKFRSTICDNAFIGCNTNLVSPVTVEKGAFIAAGSTITDHVPEDALAIARARQVNKTNWKKK